MTNPMSFLRFASVAAVMLAGSCAAPINDGTGLSSDGAVNHPITVEPHFQTIKLSFSAPDAGLMPDDAARFDAFVDAYRDHGNGAISITVPSGPDASATISYFGEKLASHGVARARILVGTREAANGDTRVEIGYVAFTAQTKPCGDWSESLADTSANATAANFGCAVQQNIAAEVADPRDLIAARPMSDADATRRNTALGEYEKGKPTAAEKTQDQSGKVSDLATQ
ncbi:MAG: CpaD family pilus assembly protein [Rhizomicrobium sp.]